MCKIVIFVLINDMHISSISFRTASFEWETKLICKIKPAVSTESTKIMGRGRTRTESQTQGCVLILENERKSPKSQKGKKDREYLVSCKRGALLNLKETEMKTYTNYKISQSYSW